jgi:hypothetical protein
MEIFMWKSPEESQAAAGPSPSRRRHSVAEPPVAGAAAWQLALNGSNPAPWTHWMMAMDMKHYETKNRWYIHWAVPWSLVLLAERCWNFTHGVNLGDHQYSNKHWLMHNGDMTIQPQRHDVLKPGELMGQPPDPATLSSCWCRCPKIDHRCWKADLQPLTKHAQTKIFSSSKSWTNGLSRCSFKTQCFLTQF